MKRRIQKKKWKEETTAQQADLLERVEALEELTRNMAAEQTAQRERVTDLSDYMDSYQAAVANAMKLSAERRARQERIRREREAERRLIRRGTLMLAGAMGLLVLALMLPAPEEVEPVSTAEPMVVAVDPADGVIEAMAMSWEG